MKDRLLSNLLDFVSKRDNLRCKVLTGDVKIRQDQKFNYLRSVVAYNGKKKQQRNPKSSMSNQRCLMPENIDEH